MATIFRRHCHEKAPEYQSYHLLFLLKCRSKSLIETWSKKLCPKSAPKMPPFLAEMLDLEKKMKTFKIEL